MSVQKQSVIYGLAICEFQSDKEGPFGGGRGLMNSSCDIRLLLVFIMILQYDYYGF